MSIPQRNTAVVLAVAAVLSLPFLVSVAAAVGHDELETIDLGELADGETRTFAHGDGEIVATRDGDVVILELPGKDGSGAIHLRRSLDCDLSDSDCIVRFGKAGDGESTFVFEVRKDGEDGTALARKVRIVTSAEHGEDGDRTIVVGHGPRVLVHRLGDGDGTDHVVRIDDDMREILAEVHAMHVPVVVMAGEGEIVLRCPEGDTTMTAGEDEAELYTCPKHGSVLEAVEPTGPDTGFRWHFRIDDDGDDDAVEM